MKLKIINFEKKYSKQVCDLWLLPEITKNTLSTRKRTTPKNIEKKFSKNKKNIFLAVYDEKLVGVSGMKIGEFRTDHLADFFVFVDPDYHRQGIGKKLVKKIIGRAKEKKLKRLEMTVFSDNKKAIKLYEKFGFKKEGVKRKSLQRNGKLYDEVIMARLF